MSSVFFILSILVELALLRHRKKEKAFGPGPANGYTSGTGSKRSRGGFFGRKRKGGMADEGHALPAHSHHNDGRDSYATEQTRVGNSHENGINGAGYNKHGESGHTAPAGIPGTTDHYQGGHHGGEVNPYHSDVNNGLTGTGHGTHVNDTALGNNRYEDGVYNSRV